MDEKDLKKFMIPLLIIVLSVLSFLVVRPIATAVILGLLFAYIFYPLFEKLKKKTKSENTAALIIVLGTAIIVLLPLLFLLPIFAKQLFQAYLSLRGADFSPVIFQLFPSLAESKDIMAEVIATSSHFSASISTWILNFFEDTIRNIPDIAFGAIILLFTFFFALREANNLKEYIVVLVPFEQSYQVKFFDRFDQVTGSVIYGQIVVGIAQGLIAGIGYYMFGIPNALLFTVLTVIIGIIPVIGPWLVWIPLDFYLFLHGNNVAGMQLLIYGLFVINWVDTLLRPVVIAKKGQMNEAIALIGAIGGIYAFGMLGFLIGPLVLAYLILLIEVLRGAKESIILKPEPANAAQVEIV